MNIELLEKTIKLAKNEMSEIQTKLESQVKQKLIELFGKPIDLKVIGRIDKFNTNKCTFEILFTITDFDSEFDLYWEDEEVKINMGTIGTYSKQDKYQLLRIKLINTIWENVEELEKLFKNFEEDFQKFHKFLISYLEFESRLETIKRQEKENEYKKIEDDLKVGDVYRHNGENVKTYSIDKITEKTIYVSYKPKFIAYTFSEQFKKKDFIASIYCKDLIKYDEGRKEEE